MEKKTTIGGFATLCLEKGKTAKETLALVKRVFPDAKTTMKCIYFYASKAGIALAKTAAVDDKQLKAAMKELAA
jgi:hypothetical protein